MVKTYNCKIGERVYYKHGMTGASRTGVVNSELEDLGSIELVETGGMTPASFDDKYVSWWSLVKIEDALKDHQIIAQIKKEASTYGMTEDEYMKAIKMI